MGKIYADANDKYVIYTIYQKENETKAYVDAACTTQYGTAELKHAYTVGAKIILADGSIVTPVSYTESSSVGSVGYMIDGETVSIGSLAAKADT